MRWIGAAMVLCVLGVAARGQEMSNGISVTGFGVAKGRPVVVELSASLSAEAELAVDASVKLRDARQKAIDAFEKLSNMSVAVESRGFVVNPAIDPALLAQGRQIQQVVVNGNLVLQETRTGDIARRTSMVEQVRITLKDADKLEPAKLSEAVMKLIDAGRSSGLQFAQTSALTSSYQVSTTSLPSLPMVVYRIPDPSALRSMAYKAAVEDAKKRATQLAEVSGAKLGRILAVFDQEAMSRAPYQSTGVTIPAGAQPTIDADGGISCSVFGEIPISVRLAVQFELLK